MHVVTVELEVRAEMLEAFRERMQDQAQTSLAAEPGCLQFDVAWSDAEPERVFLYEVYESPAAFAAHLDTPHFREFDRLTAPMILDKRVRQMTRRHP